MKRMILAVLLLMMACPLWAASDTNKFSAQFLVKHSSISGEYCYMTLQNEGWEYDVLGASLIHRCWVFHPERIMAGRYVPGSAGWNRPDRIELVWTDETGKEQKCSYVVRERRYLPQ
jgi:hypothetical protein